MAKFYAQCGPVRLVLNSYDRETAALAVVDSALQQHLWIYEDPKLRDRSRKDHLMMEALLHLDSSIKISEQGFDRSDAVEVGVPEMIQHWHRLMMTLSRIHTSMNQADHQNSYDSVCSKPR